MHTTLNEKITVLNQSLKGALPTITTKNINDILRLTIATSSAWNWSKSFNQQ